MSKKIIKTQLDQYSNSGDVGELIKSLSFLHKEYGDAVTYEIEEDCSYGDTYINFNIYLSREETDEEYQARLQSEAYRQKLQDERDHRELERLMIKFKKPSI
jgi:hypothetical protein